MKAKWRHQKTILEGDKFKIQGYNIWDYKWTCKFNIEKVVDPIYGNEYDLDIVEFVADNKTIRFGKVEFSNNVYGIYLE